MAQEIDIKVEITHEYLAGVQADSGTGDSTPRTGNPRVPKTESELESGLPQNLKPGSL